MAGHQPDFHRTHFFLPTLSHNIEFCLTWILFSAGNSRGGGGGGGGGERELTVILLQDSCMNRPILITGS